MIVPSIDLIRGQAVQLVGGEALALEAGDPRPLATRFGRVGEVAVIDLDAAREEGENERTIEELLALAPCRVGGGIRSVERARRWLDAGARQVILGTAAQPELLAQLPRERVIAALDARHGEVVDRGWRHATGAKLEDRVRELAPLVGGFLVTFVEREGRLEGVDLERVAELEALAGDARLTVAGGVRSAEEVGALDAMGVDAQVGMALYTGRLGLADALAACLKSDRPDGLWPTVVSDERGLTLGLVYSDRESLAVALEEGRGVYRSRTRGLWRKGERSGDVQELLSVALDCDRDALRFRVRQQGGGFCHLGTPGCFGEAWGLDALERRLAARAAAAPAGSYTARLLGDAGLLGSKLREEAGELAAAEGAAEVVHEAADVLYFTLVALRRAGVGLAEVERELERRALLLSRRPGDAKPE
ncbi:MAG: phosphoribosyl-ATP diphosphatase [Planctomycetota bacterium]